MNPSSFTLYIGLWDVYDAALIKNFQVSPKPFVCWIARFKRDLCAVGEPNCVIEKRWIKNQTAILNISNRQSSLKTVFGPVKNGLYNRRWTYSHTSPRRSPTIVTLHDTRFVKCRWWNDAWTMKIVVTWWSSASMIPAPELRYFFSIVQCGKLRVCIDTIFAFYGCVD